MKANGAAIKALRERSGYECSPFAKVVDIERTHYSRIESGLRNGTPAQLIAIANALKVPLPAILSDPEVAA